MRIILYTGKGGTGKTCISAATAVRCANLGYRTLVMSTDAAHSLADALDVPIGDELQQISSNLYAQEVNVQWELKVNWGKIRGFMVDFLRRKGFGEAMAEEFAVFPGMEELFSLLKLKEYYSDGKFDLLIIDCAPTGSTLRMLAFPQIMRWYMDHFFHIERKLVKIAKPMVERMYDDVVLPTDEVYFSVEELYRRIRGLQELLADPAQCTVRLVCNPERMVIKETQRAYTYLSLFGMIIDAVVVNKVLPNEVSDPFFEQWKKVQKKHLDYAKTAFRPLPIFCTRLFSDEIVGMDNLATMAEDIYNTQDPVEVFNRERPISIEKEGDDFHFYQNLPFAQKGELGLWVKGDELIIKIGNFSSNTTLPGNLVNLKIKAAKLENKKLKVTFGGETYD